MVELAELAVIAVDPCSVLLASTVPKELEEPKKLDDDLKDGTKPEKHDDVELVPGPV